ncbi:MAG: rhodanese-like domain-containing protein [Bacillota bacterium]
MNQILNILIGVLVVYQLYNFYLVFKAPAIIPSEAKKMKKDVFFLDVRTVNEYSRGHIPGSKNIPLHQLGKRLAEIPRDKTIIVVCQSGTRSAKGTVKLLKQGFKNVFSLKGGMVAWK